MRKRFFSLALLLLSSLASFGEVRLPHVLSDHAVLQREQPVRIWGWSSPAESVTVTFHDQTLTTEADVYGTWEVWLRPEKAGGPYTLTVTGSSTASPLQRSDILVGEVWIASGQSNMEMPLAGFRPSTQVKDGEKEIAAADHPKLRLLIQQRRTGQYPLVDSEDAWKVCTPETARSFSAVAYFFGRAISDGENVPVGLIDTTWGGTPAQSWISSEGIAWAQLPSVALDAGIVARDTARAVASRQQSDAEDAAAKAAGKPLPAHARALPNRESSTPATLFNGMIAPYVNYTIRGAIWYQGESDTSTPAAAVSYSRVFPALIQDWRKQWSEGSFPFLFVQISSWNGPETWWATVRDAQRRTLDLANTGMAVTIDVGEAKNIHPADKQTVGARLAESAMGIVYGTKSETASPLFVRATTEDGGIRAWFSHADGLRSSDDSIGDFEVAGDDRKFVAAKVKIEKIGDAETVIATSSSISTPRYIRYGWAPVVKSFLYNAGGLPMGTFTSESDAQMMARQ